MADHVERWMEEIDLRKHNFVQTIPDTWCERTEVLKPTIFGAFIAGSDLLGTYSCVDSKQSIAITFMAAVLCSTRLLSFV